MAGMLPVGGASCEVHHEVQYGQFISSGSGDKDSSIYLKLAYLYKTLGNPEEASKKLCKAIELDEQLLNEILSLLQMNGAARIPEPLTRGGNDSGKGSSLSSSTPHVGNAEDDTTQKTTIAPGKYLNGVVNAASKDNLTGSNSQSVEEDSRKNSIPRKTDFFQDIQYYSLPEDGTADFILIKEGLWWERRNESLSERKENWELKKLVEKLQLVNNDKLDIASALLLKKNAKIERLKGELKKYQTETQRYLQEKLTPTNTPRQLRNSKTPSPQTEKSSCSRNTALAFTPPPHLASFGSQPQAQFRKTSLRKELVLTSRTKPEAASIKNIVPASASPLAGSPRYGSTRLYSGGYRRSWKSTSDLLNLNLGINFAATPPSSSSTHYRSERKTGNIPSSISSRHTIPDHHPATPSPSALRKTPSATVRERGRKRVQFSLPTATPEAEPTIIHSSPPFDTDDDDDDKDVVITPNPEPIDWANLTTTLMHRPKRLSTPGVEGALSSEVPTAMQIRGCAPSAMDNEGRATPAKRYGKRFSSTRSDDSFESCSSLVDVNK